MTCPECGAEMNRHAIKVDYDVMDQRYIDPDFGGTLEEVHTCPRCGVVGLSKIPTSVPGTVRTATR